MLMGPSRLILISITCMALMSFKMGPTSSEESRLHFDVRSAFVTSRSDIPADVMQRVHHRVSAAIQTVTHSRLLPRVILAIRIQPIDQSDMLIGYRASSVVKVRATAVSTGEVIAEAKFRATTVGWTKETALEKLGDGIAQQVISEFRLTPDERGSVVTSLAPIFH